MLTIYCWTSTKSIVIEMHGGRLSPVLYAPSFGRAGNF